VVLGAPPTCQQSSPRSSYIIVETSGLADPGPIIQTFFRQDMQARFKLDGVVAVVDAKHISHHLQGGFLSRSSEAGRQVGFADVVLLNKTDIASPEELVGARAAVRSANPTARVLECSHCRVDTSLLLQCNFFNVAQCPSLSANAMDSWGHVHIDGVTAITIDTSSSMFNVAAVQAWLQSYIREHWRHVYRVKGLVWVYSSDIDKPEASGEKSIARLFVVQGVHAEVHGTILSSVESVDMVHAASQATAMPTLHAECSSSSLGSHGPSPSIQTGFVVIGKGISEADLRQSFVDACLACPLAIPRALMQ